MPETLRRTQVARQGVLAALGLLCTLTAAPVSPQEREQQTGAKIAAMAAEGCRVREQSASGFQFTATKTEFIGRSTLGLFAYAEGQAGAADQLTEHGDGGRGKFVEFHRATPDEWELESRCIYWGGADRFFPADVGREAVRVGDLHMKRLCRPGVQLEYRAGPTPSHPMGSIAAFDREWANQWAPCAQYIGLNFDGSGPVSALIDELIADGASVVAETGEAEGRETVVLTLALREADGDCRVCTLGLLRVDGYAPFSVEATMIGHPQPGVELLTRNVARWGDFVEVPGGPWVPCSYVQARFTSEGADPLELGSAVVVEIDKGTLAPAGGRLSDEELERWFPMGTFVGPLAPEAEFLLPGLTRSAARHNAASSVTEAWATDPLDKLVPGMDDPLFTAAPEERKRLADQLRDETRKAAQQGE